MYFQSRFPRRSPTFVAIVVQTCLKIKICNEQQESKFHKERQFLNHTSVLSLLSPTATRFKTVLHPCKFLKLFFLVVLWDFTMGIDDKRSHPVPGG